MRKFVIVSIFVLLFAAISYAHVEEISSTAEKAFTQVLAGQRIDCSQLTGEEQIQLGEALMDRMMGTTTHEQMERQLQDEGFEDQMHRNMAQMMGCGQGNLVMMSTSQMPMMMRMMYAGYGPGMMGGFGYVNAYNFFGVTLWLLAVIALVLFINWLYQQTAKPKKRRW